MESEAAVGGPNFSYLVVRMFAMFRPSAGSVVRAGVLLTLSIQSSAVRGQQVAEFAVDSAPSSPASPHGARLDKSLTQRWKVGVVITAPGLCAGILGTAPVPSGWPEQTVKLVDQEVSEQVKSVDFRTLENGVRQMLVTIPTLPAGETAKALLTFEVTRHSQLPPQDPSRFRNPTKLTRELRKFMLPSPYIESRHPLIRKQAAQLIGEKSTAWEKVEAIYDWVRDNVEYQDGELKGALAAMRDGTGDCEELTSLFIAMCRATQIPARTVWVPDHCYPEFYLEDSDGVGHWIPCQAAGTRDFGGMPEFRPILQKGDNFRVPEKRVAQRYVAEFLKVNSVRGSGQPQVQFIRQLLP